MGIRNARSSLLLHRTTRFELSERRGKNQLVVAGEEDGERERAGRKRPLLEWQDKRKLLFHSRFLGAEAVPKPKEAPPFSNSMLASTQKRNAFQFLIYIFASIDDIDKLVDSFS